MAQTSTFRTGGEPAHFRAGAWPTGLGPAGLAHSSFMGMTPLRGLALCAILAIVCSPAWARPQGRRAGEQRHHAGEWLRKYQNLPPAEQQKALANDPQFQRLSPERQQRLRERLHRFNNLPQAQQQRILNHMETWEHLTPQQKQTVKGLFPRLRELPPQRRRMVQRAVEEMRDLPPGQRQALIDSDRYKAQFTPEERNLLSGIAQLPLARDNAEGPSAPAP